VRGHWSIENTCHWSLDMTFREDELRTRERRFGRTSEQLRETAST
jgi:predicted transposase YbfD/YdcC